MSLEDIEARLRTLEDIEEIKRLKARYCAYCDDNYDARGIASLFTEDGVWDGANLGKLVGPEEIRSYFKRAPERVPFGIHMIMNPIIEVVGDTAEGSWYFFKPETCVLAGANQAVWTAGRYDEEYVRVNGEWKYRRMKLTLIFRTPFDQGWEKERFVGVAPV